MENKAGIYQITFNGCSKVYVGSAVNFRNRRAVHLCRLRSGKHCNKHLQSCFDKYGESSFMFTIIESVTDKALLIEREQYYIDTIKPDINIAQFAGNTLGFRHSDEYKKQASITSKENQQNPEFVAKVSKGWFKAGVGPSDERREQMRTYMRTKKPFSGKAHTDETKAKMRERAKNRSWENYDLVKFNELGREAAKKAVIQFTLTGVLVAEFPSTVAAMKQFGTKQSRHLVDCCLGLKKKYKGFVWKYASNGTKTQ